MKKKLLLKRGASIYNDIFLNPTKIDLSRIKLNLVERETILIRDLYFIEFELRKVKNQLQNINAIEDGLINFILKD